MKIDRIHARPGRTIPRLGAPKVHLPARPLGGSAFPDAGPRRKREHGAQTGAWEGVAAWPRVTSTPRRRFARSPETLVPVILSFPRHRLNGSRETYL